MNEFALCGVVTISLLATVVIRITILSEHCPKTDLIVSLLAQLGTP